MSETDCEMSWFEKYLIATVYNMDTFIPRVPHIELAAIDVKDEPEAPHNT